MVHKMKKSILVSICMAGAVALSGCTTASSTREDAPAAKKAATAAAEKPKLKKIEFKFPKFEFPKFKPVRKAGDGTSVRTASMVKPGNPFFASRDPADEFINDYREVRDGDFVLPAIPVEKIDKQFLRQRVNYVTREKPGTIVVDVPKRFLYLVEPNGKAIRYGVGVGKAGFEWSGDAYIAWKKQWPTWTPPAEMISRKPELEKYSEDNGGMQPGLDNPLGARALYLYRDGQDTRYRIHGTNEPDSIGQAVSNGCIRMLNEQVIDLYGRVKVGSPVVVLAAT